MSKTIFTSQSKSELTLAYAPLSYASSPNILRIFKNKREEDSYDFRIESKREEDSYEFRNESKRKNDSYGFRNESKQEEDSYGFKNESKREEKSNLKKKLPKVRPWKAPLNDIMAKSGHAGPLLIKHCWISSSVKGFPLRSLV